ncbi:hypothetical protein VNI00_013826 [Paramarasmius palmivorus]|uniref:F-box domain-containing protein n=1 Tax=Paramarasmius palmivorus TaxID=297713 RepID=A0AAW0BW29_9AGAR
MTAFSSPFGHALHTNYVPTPDELSAIRELIFEPEEKLRLLNEKISQLQVERDRLQSFIDNHRALLSPARRLPRDIVAEIFLQCLPTDQLPVCDVSKAPLVLTTVCRSWREVAVATPRLWRAIHFVFPALVGYTIDDHIQMFRLRKEGLQLWLKRAGSVPLTISCFARFNDRKPRSVMERIRALYTEYVEVFTKYATQWRALYLSFVPLESLSPLRALNASDLPQLRTLSLDANDYELGARQPFEAHPLLSVMSATSLRIFHLRRELSDPFTLPVRWSSLTELNICPVTSSFLETEFIGRLARSCPLLRKCHLAMLISDPDSPDSHVTTNLPRQIWQDLTELSAQP